MMNLNAEQWRAGHQYFHVTMNKGTYCHMATLTQNVTKQEALNDDDMKEAGALAGDSKVYHFLAFNSIID